jgi:hypothetical protein
VSPLSNSNSPTDGPGKACSPGQQNGGQQNQSGGQPQVLTGDAAIARSNVHGLSASCGRTNHVGGTVGASGNGNQSHNSNTTVPLVGTVTTNSILYQSLQRDQHGSVDANGNSNNSAANGHANNGTANGVAGNTGGMTHVAGNSAGMTNTADEISSCNADNMTSYENTLIVFDWDDTIFPTSALERSRLLRLPVRIPRHFQDPLQELVVKVRE